MEINNHLLPVLLDALSLASVQHQYQRRGGYDKLPYINHLIKVTESLYRIGEERDQNTLVAAVLHDIIEDTEVEERLLIHRFGEKVVAIIKELTDDMSLTYATRKALQVTSAPSLSIPARKIRIADKASNIEDIFSYPLDWPAAKKWEYVQNSCEVVDQIRGTAPKLENWFDQKVVWARSKRGEGNK